MAIAFVQHKGASAGAGANSITSPSITLTAGNHVVVKLTIGNGSPQIGNSVTDTLGNTYHRITASAAFSGSVFGGTRVELWYAENVTGGTGTITASWTSGGGYSTIDIVEHSGVKTSSSLDVATGANFSGTPSLTATLAGPDELIVAAFQYTNTGCSWSGSFVDRAGGGGLYLGSKELVGSGSQTATGTGCSGGNWVGSMAAFFAAPAVSASKPTVSITT